MKDIIEVAVFRFTMKLIAGDPATEAELQRFSEVYARRLSGVYQALQAKQDLPRLRLIHDRDAK